MHIQGTGSSEHAPWTQSGHEEPSPVCRRPPLLPTPPWPRRYEDFSEQPSHGDGYSPPCYNPRASYKRWHRGGHRSVRVCNNETTEWSQELSRGCSRPRPHYNRRMGWRPRWPRGNFRPQWSHDPGYDRRRLGDSEKFSSFWNEPAVRRPRSLSSQVYQCRETTFTSEEKPAEKKSLMKEESTEQQQQLSVDGFTTASSRKQPRCTAKEDQTTSDHLEAANSPRPDDAAGGQSTGTCAAHEKKTQLSGLVVDDPSASTEVTDCSVSVLGEVHDENAESPAIPAIVSGDLPLVILDEAIPITLEVVVSTEATALPCRDVLQSEGSPSSPDVVADDPSSLPCDVLEQPFPTYVQLDDVSSVAMDVTDCVSAHDKKRQPSTTESSNNAHSCENREIYSNHSASVGGHFLKTQVSGTSRVFEQVPCSDSIHVGDQVSGAYLPSEEVCPLFTAPPDMKIYPLIVGDIENTEKREGRFWLDSELEKLDEGWMWSFE